MNPNEVDWDDVMSVLARGGVVAVVASEWEDEDLDDIEYEFDGAVDTIIIADNVPHEISLPEAGYRGVDYILVHGDSLIVTPNADIVREFLDGEL